MQLCLDKQNENDDCLLKVGVTCDVTACELHWTYPQQLMFSFSKKINNNFASFYVMFTMTDAHVLWLRACVNNPLWLCTVLSLPHHSMMTSTLTLEFMSGISGSESQQHIEWKTFTNLSTMHCWMTSFFFSGSITGFLLQKFLKEFVRYGQSKDSLDGLLNCCPRMALELCIKLVVLGLFPSKHMLVCECSGLKSFVWGHSWAELGASGCLQS